MSMSSRGIPKAALGPCHLGNLVHRRRIPTVLRLLAVPFTRQESDSSRFRPRISESSIWKSLVPKFLRDDRTAPAPPTPTPPSTSRPPRPLNYNPLAVYIVLFLLIGSNAINIVGLRNEVQSSKRATDAKIELLKEVIQRIHKGEDVDVAAALGTGNKKDEDEWDAVIREIEKEDEVPDRWKTKPKLSNSAPGTQVVREEDTTTKQPPRASASTEQKSNAVKTARWF